MRSFAPSSLHRLGRISAVVYFAMIVVGTVATSQSTWYMPISLVGFVTGIVSWVLAVALWADRRSGHLSDLVVLFLLVVLGVFWGWIYLLVHRPSHSRTQMQN